MTFQPSYVNPYDMDEDYELLRFAYFRIVCGTRYPWPTATGWDWYAPDDELGRRAIHDLRFRTCWPDQGVWFDPESGRCGICGDETDLVIDHCHTTGLARGRLCQSCNIQEGKSDAPRFVAWRTSAPWLERGERWVFKTECQDCHRQRLLELPIPILLDFHRWWETEFAHFLTTIKGISTMGLELSR